MSEPKTKPTDASVTDFIAAVDNPQRREASEAALKLLGEVTGRPPVMWGPAIVGFGRYRYVGSNKKPAEWPIIAFSPRKAALVIYVMLGAKNRPDLLARLGKHELSGSCLHIKKIEDVDLGALKELAAWSVAGMRERYETD